MQDSEKDYIERNLVNLVSKIKVQDSLIAQLSNVLNDEEIEHFVSHLIIYNLWLRVDYDSYYFLNI